MRFPLRLSRWRKLSPEAEQVLNALARGDTLKAHRDLAGEKTYRLHPLNGPALEVSSAAISQLKSRRLIDSNMKFPAATYLLTQRGKQIASTLIKADPLPLGSRRYYR